jgi:hypothetical protein
VSDRAHILSYELAFGQFVERGSTMRDFLCGGFWLIVIFGALYIIGDER